MTPKLQVRGLRELRRALKQTGDDLPKALREGLRRVGEIVAVDARSRAPRRSGRLAGSVKSFPRATAVSVGSKLVYAAVHEFGGRIRHGGHGHSRPHSIVIAKQPYVQPAIAARASAAAVVMEKEIRAIAARAGWTG